MCKLIWRVFLLLLAGIPAVTKTFAADSISYVSHTREEGSFTLSEGGSSAPLYISPGAEAGVVRALKDLQEDIGKVSGATPELMISDKKPGAGEVVLVGTLGKSPLIDRLVKTGKLRTRGMAGKWEMFIIQVVENPVPGVDRALVIAGSDKRGTIFGMYDLSAQIGVSPWYWWADVPVTRRESLYVLPGRHTRGEPAVKYRGIFINDEAPALSGWAFEKFGGFNHRFYEKVFELILRMKGNYLWPAMWGREFYVEDTLNPVLADQYGIVIGTSHHEPMMRAHAEWEHYGEGAWNYKTNEATLREFWRKGIERMGENESIVTIGMRGDGDKPMAEGTEIALLEKIVADQRQIIQEVTGKRPEETPQMWALYKEVQEYYDKGMRVPGDVTLLLCDDNWGNIRKLPQPGDTLRQGGYGIYYHFDYVGGPRNYKWINTNQIERVWEQMHLAYEYGATRAWIVNVGDIKPMEFPIEFFLDYAWDPGRWPAERLPEYTGLWAEAQFGSRYAEDIAGILAGYTRFNSRRKPELLSPETYSLVHYREAERVVEAYKELEEKAVKINKDLPEEYKDAYYQLVLFPVKASANLNALYVTVAKNRLYARQGRKAANQLAEKARALFEKDAALTRYYNTRLADGKWNHMMDQTHVGYTYWQQPEKNVMPEVRTVTLPQEAEMGIAIAGSENWWTGKKPGEKAVLPEITPFRNKGQYIDVFNRGKKSFHYSVTTGADWLKVTPARGTVDTAQRLWVQADWEVAPFGRHHIPVTISGTGHEITVQAVIHHPASPRPEDAEGFVESNGYISMEAEHYTRAVGKKPVEWLVVPGLGRTLSGVTAVPVTATDQQPGGNSSRLEYRMHLFDTGTVKVHAYLSPTLNFHNDQGLRYAISIDDEEPQVINMHHDESLEAWEKAVSNNIKVMVSEHHLDAPGEHILKFWMVDPGVVLQKLVVETGKMQASYLGPPESCCR